MGSLSISKMVDEWSPTAGVIYMLIKIEWILFSYQELNYDSSHANSYTSGRYEAVQFYLQDAESEFCDSYT